MNIVAHNLMAMNTENQVSINNKKLAKNTEKLSTGYRINRAADDAAGLSISEKMRSQIRRLDQASKNIEDGVSLLKVADGAMDEMHSLIGRQRELLVKAANDIYTEDDYQAMEDEITSINLELEDIFQKTEFNSRKIFRGKDTVIDGPNTEHTSDSYEEPVKTEVSSKETIVWKEKGVTPSDSKNVYPLKEEKIFSTEFLETETVNSINDDGYTLYDENEIYKYYEYTDSIEKTVETAYDKQPEDSPYTRLRKPGDMVGNSGYINVTNEAGNLSLSCAMSQLGVRVDGQVLSYDLYGSGYSKTTTISPDKNTAQTVYNLGNGITISQKIELQSGKYNISYSVNNASGEEHEIDVRLAFDTLNTDTFSDNASGNSPYTLANDFASINISANNAIDSALGDIGKMYGNWDDSLIGNGEAIHHTGVGYWFSENVSAGGNASMGPINYGPITLLKDAYKETVTTTVETKRKVSVESDITKTTILPEYLNIQSGANKGEKAVIRLYDLSLDKLKYNAGKTEDISAFHAFDSLDHVDRVVNKITSIRAYYGAMYNRLEHTFENNSNYSENLQNAESLIRDTDMATEMAEHSKHQILAQASQAMLTQANNSNQGVLSLLQS